MHKRIIAFLMAVVMTVGACPIKAKAAQPVAVSRLKDSVGTVVYLLKEVFKDRYEKTEEEIKELVREKGYDYSLSMDSFYDQPSPYKDADYIRYLSAYMSCKKYAQENNKAALLLCEIPFLTYEVKEQSVKEYVPTKIPLYLASDQILDEFILAGDQYILEPTEVDVYEQQQNGHFKTTGEKELITPETKDVSYIDVTLNVISPDDIFEVMGIDKELVEDDYERRSDMIRRVISNQNIAQTVFINLPTVPMASSEVLAEYASYIEGAEGIRKTIIQTALSLVGRVPYEWGGKASHPGYDTLWWSYNEENGLQHGLDCSGFVQWTYMTSGFPSDIYGKLHSTKAILSSSLKRVSKENLKPGDVGVTNRLGTNHTGIYIGDGLWCHCSSDKKTVTVGRYGNFSVYYSPSDGVETIDESIIRAYAEGDVNYGNYANSYNITNNIDTQKSLYYTYNYNSEEEMLLAKLITLRARGEGMNCWIAIGEVMRNRVVSDMFPDSLYDVIYQNAGKAELAEIEPPEEIVNVAKMVLSGKLSVLANEKAVFFLDIRDMEETDESSEEETDEETVSEEEKEEEHSWESYPWFTTINGYVFYSL